MHSAQAAAGLVSVLALAAPVLAQSPAPKPVFEVASVKLETNCAGRPRGVNGIPTPGRLNIQCSTVEDLIQGAYVIFAGGTTPDMRRLEVAGGPSWIRTDLYTVNAKAEDAAPISKMFGPLLVALLEDRFQLKIHRETKEGPVYILTAPNGAAKLKRVAEGSCVPIDLNNLPKPGEPLPKFCGSLSVKSVNSKVLTATTSGTNMKELASNFLSNTLDRPVIDKTDLDGRYDVVLEFVPDNNLRGFQGRPSTAAADGLPAAPEGPNIFMALDHLGLKLEKAKGSVEVLVIDRIEKPSEN